LCSSCDKLLVGELWLEPLNDILGIQLFKLDEVSHIFVVNSCVWWKNDLIFIKGTQILEHVVQQIHFFHHVFEDKL